MKPFRKTHHFRFLRQKSILRFTHSSSLFLLTICILSFIANINSQEIARPQNFHQWGAVTLFNGLPSDNIRAIAQTPDGILWFGTQNGLARFDGRRVETFNLENLSTNKILTLQTDSNGVLWIGTESGAGRLIDGKFSVVEQTLGKPISTILTGENGTLVSLDAIFSVSQNPDASLEVVQTAARDLQFVTAARAADGNLFFGSRGRGILVEENNKILELLIRPRPFFVNVLYRDRNANLWFGAEADSASSGLFFARDISRPERIGENLGTVTAITENASGDLWLGTEKNGVFHFRASQQIEHFTFENTAGSLRSNNIYALYVDREGVIWVGTNRGACRFDPASPFNQTISENGNSNFVRSLFKSSAGQIIAGTNRGLFASTEGAWLELENFASKIIYNVAENSSKQILISASDGIFSFDGKQVLPGDARAVGVFQGKNYAAIFGRGIVEIENQTIISDDKSPTALFADDKNLWIGTAQNGVFIFDGKQIRQEAALEKLRGMPVRKILKENEDVFWFSGESGLFRYENGSLQTVIENQDVRDFTISGADVWAATLRGGLFHLKFDEFLGWLSSDTNVEQGLPSEQIFSILPLENSLLIGTNRGVVSYSPSDVAPKIIATRVLSQRLYGSDEISRLIELEYPQNSLLLEVAGLNSRTFPEQFQYGFLLKNQNGEIIDRKLSSDAQFSPTDLPPGNYKIEARAFNKDLLASEPLTISFSVAGAPFPWTAAALGVLLVIALIGLIWAIVERRRISIRNRELAAARFDLANEAERERKRIAQDLHDQTLADLRALMLMSDDLPTDTKDFRREIESVSIEIRRICEDLSPSVLENVGLAPALEFLLAHTFKDYKFSAAEDLEEKVNFPPNVQMQIYRIAQEILNNIKHHSDAKSVSMKAEISPENEFFLLIEDDGKFFDPEKIVSKGRGIGNIKSRAALIEAEISWRENEIGGTIFQLTKRS